MPAGIAIYNSFGTVQIDENYKNMFLRLSNTNASPTGPTPYIEHFLFAFQSSELALVKSLIMLPNGALLYTGPYIERAGTAAYKWWMWDTGVVPVSNYGFQVYNAAGQLVFDALQKPMRIVDYQVYTDLSWVGQSFTYAPGRQYAVVIGKHAAKFSIEYLHKSVDENGVPGWDIQEQDFVSGAKVVNNVVTLDWLKTRDETYWENSSENSRVTTFPRLEVIVVDVTGY